jgi:hypothetical protein
MKTATLWAAEQFGFGDWCPQTAGEFADHCRACGFDVPVAWESGGRIMTDAPALGQTGYAPRIIDGAALVAGN